MARGSWWWWWPGEGEGEGGRTTTTTAASRTDGMTGTDTMCDERHGQAKAAAMHRRHGHVWWLVCWPECVADCGEGDGDGGLETTTITVVLLALAWRQTKAYHDVLDE